MKSFTEATAQTQVPNHSIKERVVLAGACPFNYELWWKRDNQL